MSLKAADDTNKIELVAARERVEANETQLVAVHQDAESLKLVVNERNKQIAELDRDLAASRTEAAACKEQAL